MFSVKRRGYYAMNTIVIPVRVRKLIHPHGRGTAFPFAYILTYGRDVFLTVISAFVLGWLSVVGTLIPVTSGESFGYYMTLNLALIFIVNMLDTLIAPPAEWNGQRESSLFIFVLYISQTNTIIGMLINIYLLATNETKKVPKSVLFLFSKEIKPNKTEFEIHANEKNKKIWKKYESGLKRINFAIQFSTTLGSQGQIQTNNESLLMTH